MYLTLWLKCGWEQKIRRLRFNKIFISSFVRLKQQVKYKVKKRRENKTYNVYQSFWFECKYNEKNSRLKSLEIFVNNYKYYRKVGCF